MRKRFFTLSCWVWRFFNNHESNSSFPIGPCKCIWSENGFDVIMPSCRLAFWHSLYMDVWVDSKWEFSCEIFPLQGYNDDRWHICVIIAISFLQENSCTLQERPILGFFLFPDFIMLLKWQSPIRWLKQIWLPKKKWKWKEIKRPSILFATLLEQTSWSHLGPGNQASFYIVCYTTGTK